VGDGVDLAEAGLFILPMPEGSDGDVAFEEGAWLGKKFPGGYAVSVPDSAFVQRWNG
jgi:hypothetical protein